MPAATDLQSLADAAEQAAERRRLCRGGAAPQARGRAAGGQRRYDASRSRKHAQQPWRRLRANREMPADAEGCYRRAYAIASTVLHPDHPFVALEREEPARLLRGSGYSIRAACRTSTRSGSCRESSGTDFSRAEAVEPELAEAVGPDSSRAEAVGPDFSRARKPEAASPPPQPMQHPRRGLAVAAALGALALIAIAIVATRSRSTSSPAAAAPSVPSPAASTVAPRNPAPVAETPAPSAPAPVAPDARNAPDAPAHRRTRRTCRTWCIRRPHSRQR